MTSLDETHRQEHIADEAYDKFPILVRLVEIKPIDSVRIIEHEAGKLERHVMQTLVPLRPSHSNSSSRILYWYAVLGQRRKLFAGVVALAALFTCALLR